MSALNAAEGRIAASAFATSGIQYPPTILDGAPWELVIEVGEDLLLCLLRADASAA